MRRAAGTPQAGKSDIFGDWPWSGSPPSDLLTGGALVGAQMLQGTGLPMLGLPALYAVLRIISNGAGMSRMHMYVPQGESRRRAVELPEYDLLHNRPVIGGNAFAWRADIALNLAGNGSAYLRKWKSTTGVIGELEPLDPFRVLPVKENGQLVFKDSTAGTTVTRTTADIIPIRLGAMRGTLRGLAPITEMRLAVKAGISREVFAAAWLKRRGNPGVVLKMPQQVTPEQAKEIIEVFEADYASEENAGRTAVVGGGGDLEAMPVSMADAQFVESTKMTWQTLAGAYQIPMNFLGDNQQRRTFEDDLALAKYGVGPIIDAIDHALTADRDLCPVGTGRIVESLPEAILRMSIKDRADAYRLFRQGGIYTANELRALDNMPPHEGGDDLLATPVGGAPNPGSAGADPNADPNLSDQNPGGQ